MKTIQELIKTMEKLNSIDKLSKSSQKEFDQLRQQVIKIGIMTAIRNTQGSKDYKVLANNLYEIKGKAIPKVVFIQTIERYYPELIKDKSVNEKTGLLVPEALKMVNEYEAELLKDLN